MREDFMPIEKYYSLKAVFERVWGKGTYLELKHCSDLQVWKKYCERTLSATALAIERTVSVADHDWRDTASEIVAHGISRVKGSKSFDELFQGLSASYIEISFHQLGVAPSRPHDFRAQLRKEHWNLDCYRSVQYVQDADQKQRLVNKNKKRAAT
jgi:hypothetical protein